jgi:hypothetical protein
MYGKDGRQQEFLSEICVADQEEERKTPVEVVK